MPVVELKYGRLVRLVAGGGGGKAGITKKAVADALPYLGLDIEGEGGGGAAGTVRVEYSPNRPDYSTEWGVAAGLRGLLLGAGSKEGGTAGAEYEEAAPGGAEMRLRADPSVAAARPFIAMVAARGGRRLGGGSLAQLIAMQEDLHDGIGRRRRKASIGLHDAGPVRFPLSYTTVGRDHRFVPLGCAEEATVDGALAGTPAGAEYGRLLDGLERVPVLLDASGLTLSLPPVINGAATALSESTRDILVEVTGTDRAACEDALSVAAYTLRLAGLGLERVAVSGAGNRTPPLGPRRMSVDARLVSKSLGVEMTPGQVAGALRRAGIRAEPLKSPRTSVSCIVPRHRFDILGAMDLVEEAMLGHGVRRIEPALPASPSVGSIHPASAAVRAVRLAMVGLGYTEALSPSLTGAALLGERVGRRSGAGGEGGEPAAHPASVLDSKSADHAALRDSLLPGLLDALSRNVHEPYPQRLFEVGTVFAAGGRGGGDGPVAESARLCAVCAHSAASYTEIKGVLLAVSSAALGGPCETRAADPETAAPLAAGRAAVVHAGPSGAPAGIAGEVDADVARRFRIRQPVAALEVELAINTPRGGPRRPKSRRADGPR